MVKMLFSLVAVLMCCVAFADEAKPEVVGKGGRDAFSSQDIAVKRRSGGNIHGLWYTNVFNQATHAWTRDWRVSLTPVSAWHGMNRNPQSE